MLERMASWAGGGVVPAVAAIGMAIAIAPSGLAGEIFVGRGRPSSGGTEPSRSAGRAIIPVGLPRDRGADADSGDGSLHLVSSKDVLDERVRVLTEGSSSRSERRQAVSSLPIENLKQADRQRVEEILKSADLFRTLPELQFEVEPQVYRFFARHPHVAVSIWQVMQISKFTMRETGEDRYRADSEEGTQGRVEVLYRTDEESVVLCQGIYKSPLLPKAIRAEAVFHFETELIGRNDGRPMVRHGGRMFVAFPSQAVGTVARIISPVSNVIIDRNFREVSLFVHMMSLAMQKQPGWVEHVARRLKGVQDERKRELLKLTAHVYLQGRKRELARQRQGEDITLQDVMEPLHSASAEAPPAQ